ncbi:hypothetical protein [Paraburkholderia tropica]|uniref:Uncharacterized protein n=1 Tax=Paraburkholderia tropica TaxID=92647 RepID=A0ABX5MQS5_9BURK|nr:hypothetical protein [Paraburkholderia tropica]MDE1144396.1 hypothetical protein [Paraburkholderia tropica]PXX17286.1 hypothetical protein C7400_1062 [Paraburkholderia tropica]PZW84467.1 hypothetical protein C7399_1062 [Paraburkholderia tropica]QNB15222.1 hypothetical protein G5S35_26780 [Paraburkholderia tropica]
MVKMPSRLFRHAPITTVPTKTETLADPGGKAKLDIVRSLLALPSERGRWRAEDWQLLRHRDAFLTVDWGLDTEEIVGQWNHLLDPEHMISLPAPVAALTVRLSYKGHTSDVTYRASREDCFIVVVAIAQLANAEIDTRLCRDSLGNSDLCFLPLLRAEWSQLEEAYGTAALDQRFAQLPTNIDAFLVLLA